MFIRSFIISILIFAAFLYFNFLNPQLVNLKTPSGTVYVISLTVLITMAVLAGIMLVIIANLISLGKAKISSWRKGRRDRVAREVAENLRYGVEALLSGDLKRARLLLEKALERDPFNVSTYTALADLARDEANLADALRYLLKARELDEKNLEIFFKLATVYEAKNDPKGALEIYNSILDLDDSNRRAIAGLRELYIKQGRWKDAYEVQKNLIKLVQGERQARENELLLSLRYEFAKLTVSLGDAEKARVELRDIIKEKSNFTPAYVTLGEALMAGGKFAEAAELWEDGFKALRNPIFLIKLEDLFFSQDDPSHIATLMNFYKKWILDNPRDLVIRLFYGKLCLRLEMADDALKHFSLIADSGVDFYSLNILLAEAYRRKGRLTQAIDEYRKALGIGRTHRIPFACKICGHDQIDWSSFCPACNSWDAFVMDICEDLDAASKPVENFVLLG